MTVETRVKRIEKQLGTDRDDEIVEFPVGDGEVVRLTNREFREILDEIGRSGNRGLPGNMQHEQAIETAPQD